MPWWVSLIICFFIGTSAGVISKKYSVKAGVLTWMVLATIYISLVLML